MPILLPRSVDDACSALAAHPGATVLAGGTDLMVEINAGHRRPTAVVSLAGVDALDGWRESPDGPPPSHIVASHVVLGAGLTYTQMMSPPLAVRLPALAAAARTVGSPQIRNAGTLGGNVATASPAGDTLPVLAALDAEVTLTSSSGERTLALEEFITGPKQTVRRDDELVTSVTFAAPTGPQQFLKVGTRNAMVIAAVSLAAVVDVPTRSVRIALGAAGPTPIRARAAEAWLAERLDWDDARIHIPGSGVRNGGHGHHSEHQNMGRGLLAELATRVAAEARPIDDHRSTAEYRRHAVGVLAARAIRRMWSNGSAPDGERRPGRGPTGGGRTVTDSARTPVIDVVDPAAGYRLTVNGRTVQIHDAAPNESLLFVLRERAGLPAAKGACEQGECGSCSVLVDGQLVCSCLVLAASVVNAEVTTVEGLTPSGDQDDPTAMSDVQAAFVAEGAVQCGFCTPGLIMAVHDLLESNADPDEDQIREAISGNLCRCTGYGRIVSAVQVAASTRLASNSGVAP